MSDDKSKQQAQEIIDKHSRRNVHNWEELKNDIINALDDRNSDEDDVRKR